MTKTYSKGDLLCEDNSKHNFGWLGRLCTMLMASYVFEICEVVNTRALSVTDLVMLVVGF